jgi:hypothetical protein
VTGIILILPCLPFPGRSVTMNPLRGGAGPYLGAMGAWASAGTYLPDTTYAWSIRIGGLLEVFRIGGTSLSIYGSNELVASPNSRIRFQPLALYWEEGAILSWRLRGTAAQVGFTHRCKHDIDRDERTLIFSSVHAGVIWNCFQTRLHRYVIWLDDPTGRITGLSWSWEAGIKLRPAWSVGPYLDAGIKLDGYRQGTYSDARAESGLFVKGKGATLCFFAEYERMHESGIYREVDEPGIFQIGLRATDGRVIF